ncbi:MAG: rod-binding protein [Endozoicomonas sp.]
MDTISLQSRTMFDQASGVARGQNDQHALKTAARDFEALMLEQMMKSMREASEVLADDSLFSSREQTLWREWQDTQLAIEMSRGQGLGLADQIVAQVESIQG